MSLWLSSVLKSALPASTSPATLGRSPLMKNCTASSATCGGGSGRAAHALSLPW